MPNQLLLPIVSYPSIRKLNFLAVIMALNLVYGGVGGHCAYAGPPEPPEYEVTVIPGPFCGIFGYEPAVGLGINDLGNICGYEHDCNADEEPFFWSLQTGRITLNLPPSTLQGRALDLNSNNAVVGYYDNSQPDAGRFGFVYLDGQFTTLPSMPGSVFSVAQAINDIGDIAGFWIDNADTGYLFALLWRNDHIINLQLPFGPNNVANDINQNSQITGWMGNSPFFDSHAFIWDDGNVLDLGVIPGGFTAEGMAINNHGDVALQGRMLNDNKEVIIRSFLWRDGMWLDIGVLPGCDETKVFDINDAGQMIGFCEGPGAFGNFLWEDGVMWELNDIVQSNDPEFDFVSIPRGINTTGQIAGRGNHFEFGAVALRLSPILPIPGDLDGDGNVDIEDLLILLGSWGLCDECNDCPADLNKNCIVNTSDLLTLFANWG